MPRDNTVFPLTYLASLLLKKKLNRKAEFLGVEGGREVSSGKYTIILKGEVILK